MLQYVTICYNMLQYVQYNILHDVLFSLAHEVSSGFCFILRADFASRDTFLWREPHAERKWPGSDPGVRDNGNVAKCALTTACCPQQALDQHRIKLLSAVTKIVHPMIVFFSRQAKQRQVLSARKIFKVMDGLNGLRQYEAIWGKVRWQRLRQWL